MESSEYCKKTILNRLFALERFCGFLNEEIISLNSDKLTEQTPSLDYTNSLKETLQFLKSEGKILSPIATRETTVRNCRDSLIADNKWVTISEVLKKELGEKNNSFFHYFKLFNIFDKL